MGSCIGSPQFIKSHKVSIIRKQNDNASDRNSCETNQDQLHNQSQTQASTSKNRSIAKSTMYYILKASTEETYVPLYLKHNDQIIITINGLWSFIPERGLTDFNGYFNTFHNNLRIGQLCCRVQGGKSSPITNTKSAFHSDSNGQLVFYVNNASYSSLSSPPPIGELHIIIENARQLTHEQLSIESGWNVIQPWIPKPDYLSISEWEVVDLINKARLNPQRFAKEYIDMSNREDIGNYMKETFEYLTAYTCVPMLESSKELTEAAKDHCEDLGDNGLTGHLGTSNDIRIIKQRIMKHRKDDDINYISYYGENCYYGMQMPSSIILGMLINEGNKEKENRMNILNENYTHCGVSIMRHFSYKWVCVIVFAKEAT